ncbi:MAG: hypothetical protein ACLGGX_10270 [Bdellovibrionia bacterium]
MNLISFETVDAAIDFVASIDSDTDMEKLTETFFKAQPDLSQFLYDFSEDMGEEAQDLLMIMGMIVWKSFVSTYGELRALPYSELEKDYQAFEAAMPDDENLTEEWFVQTVQNAEEFCQPEVFKYVVSELFAEEVEDSTLTDIENTQLTLGMKFFAEELHKLATEKAKH